MDDKTNKIPPSVPLTSFNEKFISIGDYNEAPSPPPNQNKARFYSFRKQSDSSDI